MVFEKKKKKGGNVVVSIIGSKALALSLPLSLSSWGIKKKIKTKKKII